MSESAMAPSGQEVSVPLPGKTGRQLGGYLAVPHTQAAYPGVLVLQGLRGTSSALCTVALRLTEDGFAVLAIGLRPNIRNMRDLWRVIYGSLAWPSRSALLAGLQAALLFFAEQKHVDPLRMGVLVGFGAAGRFALQLACVEGSVRAAAVFNALNPRPLDELAWSSPVVGSYAALGPTALAARQLEDALSEFGVPRDIKIYPRQCTSFFNELASSRPSADSADAWLRTVRFLRFYLRREDSPLESAQDP